MSLRIALTLALPMAMFGVAVSFFTLVASGHVSDVYVWAAIIAGLSIGNLGVSLWGARVRG